MHGLVGAFANNLGQKIKGPQLIDNYPLFR